MFLRASPSSFLRKEPTLRDCLPVSYGMINILLIGSLRSPPPIRLRRTSPYSGGRIGGSPAKPDRGWRSHQRGGTHFPRPKGGWPVFPGRSPVVRFYSYRRRSRPPQPSAPQGPSNLRTLGRSPVKLRAHGAHQPSPLKGKRLTMICASLCSFILCCH